MDVAQGDEYGRDGEQRAEEGNAAGTVCRGQTPPKSGIDKAKIYGIIIVYFAEGQVFAEAGAAGSLSG